ncbi:MAG: metallophosphoesterase [Acutalibacteraceae bacterium]
MKKRKILIFAVVAVIIAASAGFLHWSNNSLTVGSFTVSPSGLPDGFDGFRIVQISDLHNKDFGSALSDRITALSPDIIIITGDIIDCHRPDTAKALDFLSNISSVAPIYYVSGNHEQRLGEVYESFLLKAEMLGVIAAAGKTAVIERNGAEICLAGIEDLHFFGSSVMDENKIRFAAELERLKTETRGRTSILLSHRPELFDLYAKNGFDVVFTGHAHGGQIRLPLIGGIFAPAQGIFPDYTSGVYENGGTSMIVSRGLGNSVFPFRIFNRPEIVLCELQAE